MVSVLRTKHTAPEKKPSDRSKAAWPGGVTFALWDSNLKTKKNASGKRPPDEAHGPGDETIRPLRIQQLSEIVSNIFAFVKCYFQIVAYFLQLLSKNHQL